MTASSSSSGPPSGDVAWTPCHMLQFAEILYKCTLCTTLPSILTSKDAFISHVHSVHLGNQAGLQACEKCHLKFTTAEDLRAHEVSGSCQTKSSLSAQPAGQTGKESPKVALKDNPPPLPTHLSQRAGSISPSVSVASSPVSTSPVTFSPLSIQTDYPEQRSSAALPKPMFPAQTNNLNGQLHERLKEHRQKEVLEQKYGKYATTLNICGQIFCFCKACSLKFDSEEESREHFESDKHKEKAMEYEKWTSRNYSHKMLEYPIIKSRLSSGVTVPRVTVKQEPTSSEPDSQVADLVSVPRRKRKRVMPMQCRRPLGVKDGSEGDSESDEAEPVHKRSPVHQTEGGEQNCSSSTMQTYSLLQADHKNLTLNLSDKYRGNLPPVYNDTHSSPLPRHSGLNNNLSQKFHESHKSPTAADTRYAALPFHRTLSPYPSHWPHLVAENRTSDSSPVPEEVTTLQCSHCGDEFVNLDAYNCHHRESHMTSPPSLNTVQFRVVCLKTLLPKYISRSNKPTAFLPREEILDHLSDSLDVTDKSMWGPACNKAIRETFPTSCARRKGKYKKTFYFGVQWLDGSHCVDEEEGVEDAGSHGNLSPPPSEVVTNGNPLQSLSALVTGSLNSNTQLLLQHLPDIVKWNGQYEDGCPRDMVLKRLSSKLHDPSVLSMEKECDQALCYLYPDTVIKPCNKEEKSQTMCYYGVKLQEEKSPLSSSHPSPTLKTVGAGPPVVNALDITDSTTSHHSMSRLSPASWMRLEKTASRPSMASLVHSTVKKEEEVYNYTENGLDLSAKTKKSGSSQKKSSPSPTPNSSSVTLSRKSEPSYTSAMNMMPDFSAANYISSLYALHWPLAVSAAALEPYSWPPGELLRGHTELEKHILLHPGPFVTARIISRRHQRLVPTVEVAVMAMQMLQGRGLGQMMTLKQGNSKVFFKALPSPSLQMALATLGVQLSDYKSMFATRDTKLESSLHDKLKYCYPQAEVLAEFYPH